MSQFIVVDTSGGKISINIDSISFFKPVLVGGYEYTNIEVGGTSFHAKIGFKDFIRCLNLHETISVDRIIAPDIEE